jgi:hypothetical protein
MQHVTKAQAGFSHGGENYDSDEDGVIVIPAEITEQAKAHGFTSDIAEKVAKPLKKDDGEKKSAGGK